MPSRKRVISEKSFLILVFIRITKLVYCNLKSIKKKQEVVLKLTKSALRRINRLTLKTSIILKMQEKFAVLCTHWP
jgi:hypothetical protein